MTTLDLKKLLQKPMDEVKRPPALPAGTYYGTISGHRVGESAWVDKNLGRKEAQVTFDIRISEPGDDVDPDEAREAQANGKLVGRAFSIEDGREYGLKLFLEGVGVDTEGKSLELSVNEATGAQVMFDITQRLDKNDPSRVYNDVKNVRARS